MIGLDPISERKEQYLGIGRAVIYGYGYGKGKDGIPYCLESVARNFVQESITRKLSHTREAWAIRSTLLEIVR